MPVCDTNGSQPISQGSSQTRAQWAAANSKPAPPYTCLKDYMVDFYGMSADQYCGALNYGKYSAAGIIYWVSKACDVSPKVLIVLLQKEQNLVTDDWPWPIQYQAATGYGCPDTAACDQSYSGLFNQIYYAARQYQKYAQQPNLFNYKSMVTRNINYNPDASCGGSDVYLQNQATAGLYNYTPYQPNSAALNNLYGTGDNCSAYGNRNFWRMYNDWFGNSYGPPFSAKYYSESSYPVIDSGVGITVFFMFKNNGTAFWKDDASTFPGYQPVHFATTFPINRNGAFAANNWLASSRPTGYFSKVYESDGSTLASDQHTVQPGQIGRFEFTIYANPNVPPGVYREYFQPILEGASGYGWNMEGWAYLDIGVNLPAYKASFVSQSPYPSLAKGSSTNIFFRFKNSGSDPWFDDASAPTGKRSVHLATDWPINRGSPLAGNSWQNIARPSYSFSHVYENDNVTLASSQHIVKPGQIAEYNFPLTASSNLVPGTYQEHFTPIIEGSPGYSWNMGLDAWLNVTVTP